MSADVFFLTPCFQITFSAWGVEKIGGVFTWRFHSSFCFFGLRILRVFGTTKVHSEPKYSPFHPFSRSNLLDDYPP